MSSDVNFSDLIRDNPKTIVDLTKHVISKMIYIDICIYRKIYKI